MAKKPVQKANNKQFAGVLVAVAVIGVAVLGYVLTHRGPTVIVVDPKIPAGRAAEGHLMGKADAPVQVLEFGDFRIAGLRQLRKCDGAGRAFATHQHGHRRLPLL